MKHLLIFTLFLFSLSVSGQSLSEARSYFNNYEYQKAAEVFQQHYDKNSQLEEEDLKKLVYSYYVIGDYVACQPLSSQLNTSVDKLEPMFYLIGGDVNRGVGKYAEAVANYEKYQSLTDEEDVSLKIKSCREIVNWDDQEYVNFGEMSSNKKMADLISGSYNGHLIQFNEIGFDKLQEMIGIVKQDNSDYAELLLSQPSLYKEGTYHPLFFEDSSMASITSMSFMPGEERALITVAYPLAKSGLKRAPNLYWASISTDYLITALTPFEYSGLNDTTSTAHATIHPEGNVIIYTKIGERTKNADLYITEKNNEGWSTPRELASLNSTGDEMFPLFSGDSLLIFSSSGRIGYGGLDIYRVNYPIDDANIVHYKSPINSFKDDFNLSFTNEDSAVFVSNRVDGTGDDDLYYITFTKKAEEELDTFNLDEFIAQWKIKNVYFEFDKFILQAALSDKNVNEIQHMLATCESCKIELTGFADSRGAENYNQKLSLKRANTVKEALVQLGFSANRINTIGKGETDQPQECGANCSEEQHRLNRVVEINVIK